MGQQHPGSTFKMLTCRLDPVKSTTVPTFVYAFVSVFHGVPERHTACAERSKSCEHECVSAKKLRVCVCVCVRVCVCVGVCGLWITACNHLKGQ